MKIKVIDVKVPVKAPFFLPTVAGLDPTFDRSEKDEEPESKISSNSSPLVSLVSDIGRQLENYLESETRFRIFSALHCYFLSILFDTLLAFIFAATYLYIKSRKSSQKSVLCP